MRPVAFLMMASLLVLFSGTMLGHASAQSPDDNLWYFGKGVKKNMFLTYRINDNTIVPPGSFNMTIYFQNYNKTGAWTAPVIIAFPNGTTINGTFSFTRPDFPLTISIDSTTPGKFRPFALEYDYVMGGIETFAAWPRSLNTKHWGSITQSLGIADLNGTKIITVPAGTFNCTEVIHASGTDYVNKDLPYPVEGSENRRWYELVAMGYGQPTFSRATQTNPSMVSPLEQFKSGVPSKDTRCGNGLQLVIKTEDGSPACVMGSSAKILIERGWGHLP